ncbi:glycosyltransferase family 4 protein [Akkermansiaceae bacterium]|nr:glycosyltransferase family 4 protein [Akkermansiaceae bacterium]MDB4790223.1 glycosyltransferase family 4 protein [Akkermansiaceae bacterium]
MKLGFYYHIPIRTTKNGLVTAGFLGCFLDALAARVDELVLFLHEAAECNAGMDYELTAQNVRFVSLGRKPHPVSRTFLGTRLVDPVRKELSNCDMLLVRAPTHLFRAWARLCQNERVRLVPLLVGDYASCNANIEFTFLKKQVLKGLNRFVDWQERRYLGGKQVLVNSAALAEKYQPIAKVVHQVRTTTLSEDSFFEREDTCGNDEINLLYTGRFDWQKGLQELFDAFVLIVKGGCSVRLHMVGWQDGNGSSIEESLKRQGVERGVSDCLIFHGRKKVGAELDEMYRMADIYVIPSYAEGFPRTIWEAMANSLPVIATKVGSIPEFLVNKTHALLIAPQDVESLKSAILCLVNEPSLRKRLISEGSQLAMKNTLESQSEKMVELLKGKQL